MPLARHHRVPALTGDLGGVVLLALTDIGVEHVGAGEELGLGRPRHQGGQGDPLLILQLVAKRLGEVVDERLGRIIDRVEGAGDEADDRSGHQHLALAVPDHRRQHALQQINGAGHIGVDRAAPVLHRLVEESPAPAVSRIGAQHIDPPTIRRRQQRVHALQRRQIGLDRLNLRTFRRQLARGGMDGGSSATITRS